MILCVCLSFVLQRRVGMLDQGAAAAGRYLTESHFVAYQDDDGSGTQLASPLIQVGCQTMRAMILDHDAGKIMSTERDRHIKDSQKQPRTSADNARHIQSSKMNTTVLRIAAVMEVLQIAENDVNIILGNKQIIGTKALADFMIQVAHYKGRKGHNGHGGGR